MRKVEGSRRREGVGGGAKGGGGESAAYWKVKTWSFH